jgi:hypothetical protein
MVFVFDTISYARHLRERGVPQDQAEEHAEAARQFITTELVTKADLAALDVQTLRLTVGLGFMLAALIALLGAILKLT